MENDLPSGWKTAIDPKTKRTYYYHVKTKEVSWEKPKNEKAAILPAPQKEIVEEEKPKLPPGWEAKFDEKSKRTYYVNKQLQKSTWKFPTDETGTVSKKVNHGAATNQRDNSAQPNRTPTPTTPAQSAPPSKSSSPVPEHSPPHSGKATPTFISQSNSESKSASSGEISNINTTSTASHPSSSVITLSKLPAQHTVSYETSLPGTVSLLPIRAADDSFVQASHSALSAATAQGGCSSLPPTHRSRHSVHIMGPVPGLGMGSGTEAGTEMGMGTGTGTGFGTGAGSGQLARGGAGSSSFSFPFSSSFSSLSSSSSSSLLASGGGAIGAPLRALPPNLKAEIHSFKIEGFAKEHFAKHQTGFLFLKKAIPLDELMAFQREALSKPLLKETMFKKNQAKEALKNFEDILIYTGMKQMKERSSSSSSLTSADLNFSSSSSSSSGLSSSSSTSSFSSSSSSSSSSSTSSSAPVVTFAMKMAAQRIIGRGTATPELRDEIYLQLCKQTNPTPSLRKTLTGKRNAGVEKSEEKEKKMEKRRKEEREQMEAIERGWQLLVLCCDAFAPSRDIEKTLLSHLDSAMEEGGGLSEGNKEEKREGEEKDEGRGGGRGGDKRQFEEGREEELGSHLSKVSVLAQYALNRLQNTTLFGGEGKGRGREKVSEEQMNELANITSTKRVFSCSLNEMLLRQQSQHFIYSSTSLSSSSSNSTIRLLSSEEKTSFLSSLSVHSESDIPVPVVCLYLSVKLMAVGGLRCEGVFRKCITIDETEASVRHLNKGEYTLSSQNPHLFAVLLKTWLKRLTDPLIPFTLYDAALAVAAESPEKCVAFVESAVPPTNRALLKYLCRLLRVVAHPSNVDANRMNASNLALIFAPTLIRMDTNNPAQAVKNLKMEIQFVFHLVLSLFPSPEEEKLFADCDAFVCANCGFLLSEEVLGLFRRADGDAK